MHTFLQDLRYAIRLLIKSPSFAAVALATLAVGIGANAAIFSVVNGLLLKPLPYAEPERLVMVWRDLRARGGPPDEWLGPAHFFDWTNRSTSFEATTVFRGANPSLTGNGEPEQLRGWQVTSDFFRLLGVRPALGRDFRAEDDQPGAPATAIITHGLWQRRFGGDPNIVGRTISLDREPCAIIGVLPASYQNPFQMRDIFRPLQLNPVNARRNATLQMIARLKPRVTMEQAQAEMASIGSALAVEHPQSDENSTIRLAPLHDEIVGDVRTPALALLGAVALVLLIACANIASLQLARASVRVREIAVRTALGAGRVRVIRQLLTESLLLGILGGIGGMLLSSWMMAGLLTLAPEGTPRLEEIVIDRIVLAFAVLLATGTSVVFGLVPALHSVRGDATASLKEGGRSAGGARGIGLRSTFVVAELALASMLLVGAGLLMRTLANIQRVDPGFSPERVLSAVVVLPATGYEKPPQVRAFFRALIERLDGAPGIEAAGLVHVMPFSGANTDTSFRIEGRPDPRGPEDQPVAWYRIASPGYFRAMGLRTEAGRFIESRDHETGERVAVVNRRTADRYWPGENPLGRRIFLAKEPFTIVGIVANVRHSSLREEPRGELYLSDQQFATRRQTIVIKTSGNPESVMPLLRERVASLDPNLPLSSVAALDELMADSLALPRMMTTLMSAFAGASLLLAAIGIYGLMAYSVTLRTREFGIRIALGATTHDVLRLVLAHAARLTVVGVAVGTLASLGAARGIRTMLFGVTETDVPTFIVTVGLLGGIGLLASYLPARRAVRVEPVTALRSE